MNNVKHPRQTVSRITSESSLLQLQTLTSRQPYFLHQLIRINLKLNPAVGAGAGAGGGGDVNADQIRIVCFGHRA